MARNFFRVRRCTMSNVHSELTVRLRGR